MPAPNDYVELIAVIRTELEMALKPLADDIRELKDQSYSREMIDTMFHLRDERLDRLKQLGGISAGLIMTLWALLASLQLLHIIK